MNAVLGKLLDCVAAVALLVSAALQRTKSGPREW
ncbi:uncharacterized protein METZ01_LOCUS144680 [marine metagenome]|uniref:Uncharacterized protein n=1 Tax=marine metagenome TaxID=408172 RepID=A0A381ZRF4_9ZZZZ